MKIMKITQMTSLRTGKAVVNQFIAHELRKDVNNNYECRDVFQSYKNIYVLTNLN